MYMNIIRTPIYLHVYEYHKNTNLPTCIWISQEHQFTYMYMNIIRTPIYLHVYEYHKNTNLPTCIWIS